MTMADTDTFLEATDAAKQTVGKAGVVVVIPTRTESFTAEFVTAGQNVVESQTRTPPNYGVPLGFVGLSTSYEKVFKISVLDQFDRPLDPIYNGLDVYEVLGEMGQAYKLNVKVSNGLYDDSIGWVTNSAFGAQLVENSPENQLQIESWRDDPTPRLPFLVTPDRPESVTKTVNPLVVVIGGHRMSINRTIVASLYVSNSPDGPLFDPYKGVITVTDVT